MRIKNLLKSLFSKTAAPASLSQKLSPIKAAPDTAAEHIFQHLGQPRDTSTPGKPYKSQTIELELGEALELAEKPEFPEPLKQIIEQTIEAFSTTLDTEKFRAIRQKSNHFTLAYTLQHDFHHNSNSQDHIWSIGCPLDNPTNPRFTMRLQKQSYQKSPQDFINRSPINQPTLQVNTTWRNKSIHMLMPAPEVFHALAPRFFNYLVNQYATPDVPQSSPAIILTDRLTRGPIY